MNRRSMLKWLAGGAVTAGAGAVLLPERTIFLPPRGGWPSSSPYRLYSPEDARVWLQQRIEEGLNAELSSSNPLYYNHEGIARLQDTVREAHRITFPKPSANWGDMPDPTGGGWVIRPEALIVAIEGQ